MLKIIEQKVADAGIICEICGMAEKELAYIIFGKVCANDAIIRTQIDIPVITIGVLEFVMSGTVLQASEIGR